MRPSGLLNASGIMCFVNEAATCGCTIQTIPLGNLSRFRDIESLRVGYFGSCFGMRI